MPVRNATQVADNIRRYLRARPTNHAFISRTSGTGLYLCRSCTMSPGVLEEYLRRPTTHAAYYNYRYARCTPLNCDNCGNHMFGGTELERQQCNCGSFEDDGYNDDYDEDDSEPEPDEILALCTLCLAEDVPANHRCSHTPSQGEEADIAF